MFSIFVRSRAVSLGVAALSLACCSTPSEPSDRVADDATQDRAAITDSASMDAAPDVVSVDSPMDSSPMDSSPMDSGVVVDTGVTIDTGVTVDTGVVTDTGVAIDTGITVDAGVAIDAGVRLDSGVLVDTGVTVDTGVIVDSGVALPEVPRPVRPLSTTTVSVRRPLFRWALGADSDGARLQLCRDRACTTTIATIDAVGTSAAPTADLPAGVVYWRLFGRRGPVTATTPSPTWQAHISPRNAARDTAYSTLADFNGDGFAEVVIGARSNLVEVYAGSSAGLAAAPLSLTTSDAASEFGYSVASAGDVNGDGFADLIVGAYSANTRAGRVYLFHGSRTGLSSTPSFEIAGPYGAEGRFGSSVSTAGDVNGDGYADIIVGAEGENTLTGRAYVYLGSARGVSSTVHRAISVGDLDPPGFSSRFSYFGSSVSGGGDVDGDGFDDVIVGGYGASSNQGYVQMHLGSAMGVSAVRSRTYSGLMTDGEFGRSVAINGDINGDGFADIAIGAPGENLRQGRVHLIYGAASAPFIVSAAFRGADVAGGFGKGLAIGGDTNGDGFSDLIAGSYQYGANGVQGRASAYLGSASGIVTTAAAVFSTTRLGGWFGWAVAIVGDTDGDGFGECVVGAHNLQQAYLHAGSATGPRATPARTFAGPNYYGYGLAR